MNENEKLIESLCYAINSLEFYADKKSWIKGRNDGYTGMRYIDRERIGNANFAGKNAREAISTIKRLLENTDNN